MDQRHSGHGRRAFLAGAAGLAGAALLSGDLGIGPSGLEMLAAEAPAAQVGYLQPDGRVVPASSLRAGALDGRGVVVRLAGLRGHVAGDASVLADLHLPSATRHGSTVPFYAYTRRADSSSTPSRLGVAAARGARFGVYHQVTTAAGRQDRVAVFASGRRSGMVPLVPGTYLVGLDGDPADGATAIVLEVAAA